MSTEASKSKRRAAGVLTVAVAVALLSATGQPTPKVLARLAELGVTDLAARLAVHAVPVVLVVSAVLLGRALGKGRSKTMRWILYALLGAVAGFFTGYSMDVLVGLPAAIQAVNGPLAEPSVTDIVLWAIGGISIATGLMVAALAVFGSPAAYALNLEPDDDPEAMDIRKAERGILALSSAGLSAMGIASIALAIAQQSGDGATLGPSIIALVTFAASGFVSIILWNLMDELQRRQVVNAYAVSAVIFTAGAFVWSIAEVQGLVPPFGASASFAAITFVQMMAASIITAAVAGNARAKKRRAA
jgi:hypothetical protein